MKLRSEPRPFFLIFLKSTLPLLVLTNCASCLLSKHQITAEKASQIAERELVKTYGEQILKQRPFTARLNGDRWIVDGIINCPKSQDPERINICHGGVGSVEIDKNSGTILKVTHGK